MSVQELEQAPGAVSDRELRAAVEAVREGKLKPFKVGTRTLFLGAELDRFVRSAQHAA